MSQSIFDAYAAKFTNLDEVAHMSLISDPRFGELLENAIKNDEPLTRAKVESVFGEVGWEELH